MAVRTIHLDPLDYVAATGHHAGPVALAINPHHSLTGLTEAHSRSRGAGVVVGIVDTGCDLSHSDLIGAVRSSHDFTGSRVGPLDLNGHGTHCAGIVASRGKGQSPVGAAPEATLIIAKGLGDSGSGRSDGLARAIDYCVQGGADIISLSWGGPGVDVATLAACRSAVAAGCLVVAASGNDGPNVNTPISPGTYEECLCVGACDDVGTLASFSTRGPQVDVLAPGVNILSTYPGNKYARMNGTSMATPQVAGLAAVLLAICRERFGHPFRGKDVSRFLALNQPQDTGDPTARVSWIDVKASIALIDATPPPSPTPTPVPVPVKPSPVRTIDLRWTVENDRDVIEIVRPTKGGEDAAQTI